MPWREHASRETMTARILTSWVGGLSVLAFAGSAIAQREGCPPSSSDIDLALLYRYAQYAQAAYGEQPANACTDVPQLHRATADALASTALVPLAGQEYLNLDLPGNPRVAVYEGRMGVHFATCRRDDLVPGLALSISRTPRSDDDSVEQRLLFRLSRVIDSAVAGVLTEELVLVEYEGGAGPQRERLWAVRGTEWDWRRMLPNLLDLLNHSCVFEMAARIVASTESSGLGRLSVVGHSLGGSVAQYVARDRTERDPQQSGRFTA